MFEAHVLHLLRRYLGEYVHGLSVEALRISVWKGDVVLKDLKLKAEALNSLKLPVTVKAGFIGTITLKVPWKSLGKEPVIVLIDRVFILAYPLTDGRTLKEDGEKLFEAKLQQIEETESATLEAISKSKLGSPPPGNSWLGSLIATIIGNLKISISNVHIRYEDSVSNPGHPFCSGVTLAKLAAVTMDEQGNETFDTSGALDKLRKVSLVFCSCGPFRECIICGSQFQIPLCIIFSIVLMSIWTKPPNKRSKATLSSTEKTKNQQQHFAHNKRPIKMNRSIGNIPKCLDKDVQPL